MTSILHAITKAEPYTAQLTGKYKFEHKIEAPTSTYWTARLANRTYSHVRLYNTNCFDIQAAWALYEWGSVNAPAVCTRPRKPRIVWKFQDGTVCKCPTGHNLWAIPLGRLVSSNNITTGVSWRVTCRQYPYGAETYHSSREGALWQGHVAEGGPRPRGVC